MGTQSMSAAEDRGPVVYGFDGLPIAGGDRVALAAAPARRGTVDQVYAGGRDPWCLVKWDDGRTVAMGAAALEVAQ